MDERARLATQAHIYEEWQGIDRELTEAVARLIVSRMEGWRGIELGWGPGVMHPILAARLFVCDVVEGNPTLAVAARRELATRILFQKAVVYECLFEDFHSRAVYDNIIMSDVLEHVKNPRKLLRRAVTWLRDGGRIHIAVPNGNSVHRLLGAMAGMMGKPTDLGETDKRNGHRRVYTWDSIKREVERAGLELVHMEGVLLKPFPGARMNTLTEAERRRLFELAPSCPKLCAEVYVECRRRESC